jgi:hypothetical protein
VSTGAQTYFEKTKTILGLDTAVVTLLSTRSTASARTSRRLPPLHAVRVYPGYLVGTGGTGDVDTAMGVGERVGSGQIEVFKWRVAGFPVVRRPFSGQGYDGTLAAMNGCPQHIVLGLPLVEGSRTYSVTTTAGSSTIVIASGTFSTSYLNADISWPGIPARCLHRGVRCGAPPPPCTRTLTHAPVNATQATVNGVSQNVATSTATFLWRLHHVTAGAHDASSPPSPPRSWPAATRS